MKKGLLLALALPLFLFTSCEKDDQKPNCETTMASLAGTYKITAADYKLTANAPAQNVLTQMFEPCQLDDTQTIEANGTWTYTDAGVQCGGNQTGTWSLSGNTFTIGGETGTIVSYDCKTLVVTRNSTVVTGDILTITFTKQ